MFACTYVASEVASDTRLLCFLVQVKLLGPSVHCLDYKLFLPLVCLSIMA